MANVVSNWLTDVGLTHVIPQFESQGISNVNDLVKLKYQDYPSLGVIESDDRKTLYYLIQRIKIEIGKESPKKPKQQKKIDESKHKNETNLNDSSISIATKESTQVKSAKNNQIRRSLRLQKLKASASSTQAKTQTNVVSASNTFDSDEKDNNNYGGKNASLDYFGHHKSSSPLNRSKLYDKENTRNDDIAKKKINSNRLSIEPSYKLYKMQNSSPSKVDSNLQRTVLNYSSPQNGSRKLKSSTKLPEIQKLPKEYSKSPRRYTKSPSKYTNSPSKYTKSPSKRAKSPGNVSQKSTLKTPAIIKKSSSSVSSISSTSSTSSRLSYSSRNKVLTSSNQTKNKNTVKRLSSIPN